MRRKNLILTALVIAKFILQYFAIDPVYELHRDEFLHLDLGQHLAWGYTSVPPVTGFLSYLIYILGNHSIIIKLFPALFGALTIIVVWKTVEALGGQIFALTLAGISILLSVLLRINTLYQPNSLDILCWSLFFYIIVQFIKTNNNKWIYAAGVIFAVGFLNKYNIGFLLLGLLPAIIITPHRKIFFNKHFYFSLLLALILILPNLLWQLNNGLPVIHHMRLLADSQLINVSRSDFLIEQLLFFTGAIFVILLSFYSFIVYKPFKDYRIILYAFLFTMTFFVVFKAKNYYSIGLYPVIISFGAVYVEHFFSQGKLRFFKPIFLLLPVLIIIPTFKLMLPVLSPEEIIENKRTFERMNLNRWEDGKMHHIPQDYADMLGWQELASLVDSAVTHVEDKDRTIVQCENWGQAGAINFYSKLLPGNAYTMNADYLNWYPLHQKDIKNVILVKDISDDDKTRTRERELFEEIFYIGEVKNIYAREKGSAVYLLKNAKVSINIILANEIASKTAF